jgi:hypothetical protein
VSTPATPVSPTPPTASSPTETQTRPAGAGAGVLGQGLGTSTSGRREGASTMQSVIAKGQLPYSGLALPAALAVAMTLALGGLVAWSVSASPGRRTA